MELMFLGGFNNSYLLLVVPAMIFAFWAQFKVKGTFNKFSKERTMSGITGVEAAQQILNQEGLYHVRIERTPGHLTDHFDPRSNVVRLSESVYDQATVAAVGVAAHEVGHAIQHAHGYSPLKMRSAILPVASIGSNIAPILIILGLILEMFALFDLGIILFGAMVLFQLVTLPVEFNASSRALEAIEGNAMLASTEVYGAKKVLNAAAFTYVAALIVSLMQLLRFVMLRGRR
jgi:hypothetical protein